MQLDCIKWRCFITSPMFALGSWLQDKKYQKHYIVHAKTNCIRKVKMNQISLSFKLQYFNIAINYFTTKNKEKLRKLTRDIRNTIFDKLIIISHKYRCTLINKVSITKFTIIWVWNICSCVTYFIPTVVLLW